MSVSKGVTHARRSNEGLADVDGRSERNDLRQPRHANDAADGRVELAVLRLAGKSTVDVCAIIKQRVVRVRRSLQHGGRDANRARLFH